MSLDEQARQLTLQYGSLAAKIASKFYNIPGHSYKDIEQYANQALFKAARAWVGGKSQIGQGDFQGYATTAIENYLKKIYNKEEPVSDQSPSWPLGTSDDDWETELRAEYGDPIKTLREAETKEALDAAMRSLTPREKFVVVQKYKNFLSLSEIGKNMTPPISKERVRQILQAALAKVKLDLEKLHVRGVATDGGISSRPRSAAKRLLKGNETKAG